MQRLYYHSFHQPCHISQTLPQFIAKPGEGGSGVGFVIGGSVWVYIRFCSAGSSLPKTPLLPTHLPPLTTESHHGKRPADR